MGREHLEGLLVAAEVLEDGEELHIIVVAMVVLTRALRPRVHGHEEPVVDVLCEPALHNCAIFKMR